VHVVTAAVPLDRRHRADGGTEAHSSGGRPHLTLPGALAVVAMLFLLLSSSARTDVTSASVAADGSLSDSELTPGEARSSSENNPNWWVDGNDAVAALQHKPSGAQPPATRPSERDGLPVEGGSALALLTGALLIAASSLGSSSASAGHSAPERRRLMPGLERWLAHRDWSRELEPASEIGAPADLAIQAPPRPPAVTSPLA
jgi:hypothetical protein